VSGQSVDAGSASFCGLYGKLPAVGDFVRRDLPAATASRLHEWLQSELGKFAGGDAAVRERALDRPSAWRFAASAGVLADPPVAGVLTASRDKVGRLYPCAALADSGGLQPAEAAARTAWFDAVEARLLAAVADAAPVEDLLQALREVGAPGEIPRMPMEIRSVPGGVMALVEGPPRHGGTSLAAAAQLLPVAAGASLWWRETPEGLQLLLVDALPVDAAFESLFAPFPSSPGDPLSDFVSPPASEPTALHV
jgi:type VI secretion system protein ImpM